MIDRHGDEMPIAVGDVAGSGQLLTALKGLKDLNKRVILLLEQLYQQFLVQE